jgi:hypothetical protein
MSKALMSSIAVSVLIGIAGCKQDNGGDSMGSMKTNEMRTNTAAPATMPSAMTYTCAMHPEVVSDKPGKCPKCGMALVAKKK